MANTPQAKKRIRRNDRRAEINGNRLGRIRTFVKKVEAAIEGGDKSAASVALAAAQPEIARGVARGVLHKNTVSRKLSRLTKAVTALSTPPLTATSTRSPDSGGASSCSEAVSTAIGAPAATAASRSSVMAAW